ncbi:unnamed protein product (mitochondrion) [Plasmodiophora brassicae]|uniref:Uncharacterized protein n=1 Tax=Plasmodiophora brassicae TaxID=37360 RepID=A0A0G4J4G8_PLABS|nr:hypothetical protein PBRA_002401 [Plasmodiophora brassicae]SPQ93673.1 unnamed protein product [Plasmodiophora brassicae]
MEALASPNALPSEMRQQTSTQSKDGFVTLASAAARIPELDALPTESIVRMVRIGIEAVRDLGRRSGQQEDKLTAAIEQLRKKEARGSKVNKAGFVQWMTVVHLVQAAETTTFVHAVRGAMRSDDGKETDDNVDNGGPERAALTTATILLGSMAATLAIML